MTTQPAHLAHDVLIDYWLGDLDAAALDEVEAHLMACDACGHALDGLIALGKGVREALHAGAVSMVVSRAALQRLAAHGLRVREYRLPHNGSVNCTVAPDDDVLVSCLEAPLQGVRRLDALLESSLEPGVQHRLESLPFDAAAGEVLYMPPIAHVKQLPANTLRVTLQSVEAGTTRDLGTYVHHHRPWTVSGA